MRYIIIILICISQIAICELKAQTVNQPGLRDYQNSAHELPDSILYIMSTDTSGSREGLGKWRRADSLVNSLGDHDFYGLNTNRPPFFGEDSIETALDTMYVLFKGLDGGLATKIEMLKNGVLRFDQDDATATGRYLIVSKPQQQTEGNTSFNFTTISQPNTGIDRNNDVFSFGWNLNPGGGVLVPGEIGFGMQFEGFYRTAGSDYGEWHIVHIDTNGVVRKPISWFLNHYNPALWAGDFLASEIQFNDPTNNLPFAEFERSNTTSASFKLLGSAAGQGAEFYLDEAADNMQITSFGLTNPHLYLFDNVATSFVHVNYLEYLNAGTDAIRIAGQDANGYLTDVPTGWGIDLDGSGTLVVDSSQVATQYDLTTISAGATNLSISQSGGTQVIQSSTGTDVGVRNLYGLLITEGATDTLHFRVDSSLIATQYDITQIPISSLKAAAATNTINNANYAQEWQWNTLAGTTGLKLSSTSTAAASNAQKLFEISLSGANASSGQSTYGGYFSNTHTGTTSTNYALYGVATGAASANYGLYGTSNSSYTIGTSLGAGVSGRNSNGGIAIEGITTSGGIGVYAESPDGYASYSYTTNGTAAAVRNNWSTNSDYGSVLDIYRNTSNGSNGAAGIGGGIAFYTETSTGATPISNQIKSIWTTATHASRTSSMVFTGLNSGTEGDILTLKGTKQLQFHGYGTGGAFTASPVADLFVDASGNVVQGSMTGQSWLADGDDATAAALISNQTFKITGGSGYTGITTDLFDNAATDSIVIKVNGDKFNTVGTPEADDYVLLHDENGAGADVNEKILWSDLYSLISGDGNFAENNLTWSANRTHDQSTYTTTIQGSNMAWKFEDTDATTGPSITLEGNIGNSDAPFGSIVFQYSDSGFATDQAAWTLKANRETDDQEHSTLQLAANEATAAPPVLVFEENENLSDNTQETYTQINSGVALTQYWESTGANAITLDRAYYNVALLSGHTGTITLPEIYGINEANTEMASTLAPIGQEYVICNYSGSSVTIAVVNNTGTANDDYLNGVENGTVTLADGKCIIAKAVTTVSNEGRWTTWLSD